MFTLDSRLESDTIKIGSFPLSLVLLSKDANYPWCILVPQREGVREIHHLSSVDQQQLMKESCLLAEQMERLFQPTKMNVAALGNMVPQLHVHHVARFAEDKAWPGPIWGCVPTQVYDEEVLNKRIEQLKDALLESGGGFNLLGS